VTFLELASSFGGAATKVIGQGVAMLAMAAEAERAQVRWEEIGSLQELLFPIGADRFFTEFYGKKPLYLDGESNRFASLLTLDSLNGILGCRLSAPLFRVVRENSDVPKERYSKTRKSWLETISLIDLGALNMELSKGATLVINALEQLHRPVSSLCRILEAVLCNYIDVVAFVSFGETQALNTHWDHEEVFILQVMGKKHWRLFPHVRPHPTVKDFVTRYPAPKEDPYWEGDLTAGSLLYIPSGWWHDVRVTEGPSVHLSFGSDVPTGLDLGQELLRRLAEVDAMRAILPRHGSAPEAAQYMTEFRAAVQQVADQLSLDEFFANRDAVAPARGRLSLPWSAERTSVEPWTVSASMSSEGAPLPKTGWVHWLLGRVVPLVKSDGQVSLQATGYRFRFDDVAEPVITFLMQHRKVEIQVLRLAFPSSFFEDLMRRMVSWGLVALTPESLI
jgi:ribosomal protein L16 Arg81 hydroxylase